MGEEREVREQGGQGGGSGFDWGSSEDLTVLSVGELESLLEDFASEEREVSYRRRVLQGRIDLIRAEIVRRGGVSVPPEELARILLGDTEAPGGSNESLPEGTGDRGVL